VDYGIKEPTKSGNNIVERTLFFHGIIVVSLTYTCGLQCNRLNDLSIYHYALQKNSMKKYLLFLIVFATAFHSFAQKLPYPYPVHYLNIQIEGSNHKMAYMDVSPSNPNGETALLLHGKNFNGYYWKDVIAALSKEGYRVIVPDQIGWGRSDKPLIHYSFPLLANNTKQLLDTLEITKVNLVAHSMGGMLATRFAIMYPNTVSRLVLENPIGLEDYSLFVPYQSTDKLYANERQATYESLKKYQQSYYPVWKPEYEQYVQAQLDASITGNKDTNALVNALTYQIIYEQPVVYYFDKIKAPTLLIIGQEDRTVVGKNLLTDEQKKQYGHYPTLGKKIKSLIRKSVLAELAGVGHIPHIQSLAAYSRQLLTFLKERPGGRL
jgi:pimeloyl-ACP methyl ester carboxylesterase